MADPVNLHRLFFTWLGDVKTGNQPFISTDDVILCSASTTLTQVHVEPRWCPQKLLLRGVTWSSAADLILYWNTVHFLWGQAIWGHKSDCHGVEEKTSEKTRKSSFPPSAGVFTLLFLHCPKKGRRNIWYLNLLTWYYAWLFYCSHSFDFKNADKRQICECVVMAAVLKL